MHSALTARGSTLSVTEYGVHTYALSLCVCLGPIIASEWPIVHERGDRPLAAPRAACSTLRCTAMRQPPFSLNKASRLLFPPRQLPDRPRSHEALSITR